MERIIVALKIKCGFGISPEIIEDFLSEENKKRIFEDGSELVSKVRAFEHADNIISDVIEGKCDDEILKMTSTDQEALLMLIADILDKFIESEVEFDKNLNDGSFQQMVNFSEHVMKVLSKKSKSKCQQLKVQREQSIIENKNNHEIISSSDITDLKIAMGTMDFDTFIKEM